MDQDNTYWFTMFLEAVRDESVFPSSVLVSPRKSERQSMLLTLERAT